MDGHLDEKTRAAIDAALAQGRQSKEICARYGVCNKTVLRRKRALGLLPWKAGSETGKRESWRVPPEVIARIDELLGQGIKTQEICTRLGVSWATVQRRRQIVGSAQSKTHPQSEAHPWKQTYGQLLRPPHYKR